MCASTTRRRTIYIQRKAHSCYSLKNSFRETGNIECCSSFVLDAVWHCVDKLIRKTMPFLRKRCFTFTSPWKPCVGVTKCNWADLCRNVHLHFLIATDEVATYLQYRVLQVDKNFRLTDVLQLRVIIALKWAAWEPLQHLANNFKAGKNGTPTASPGLILWFYLSQ